MAGWMQSWKSVRAATTPKLVAAQKLAAASAAEPVESWAHFSSLSALLGTAGQANYAAANAQLNTWADVQQNSGDPYVVLGDWSKHLLGPLHGNVVLLIIVRMFWGFASTLSIFCLV